MGFALLQSLEARQSQLSVEEDTEGLLGHALRNIANSHFHRCDFKLAIDAYEQAIAAYRVKFEPQGYSKVAQTRHYYRPTIE